MYTLLAFFGIGLLAWLVQSLVTASRRRRMARQLGCEDVFRRKSRLPLGIDFIQAIAKADRENAVPNHFVETYERLGRRNTWTQNLLGRDTTMTVAPENIKAMLATQFKDFELGPIRKGAFSPLFANGIFSDDGARWEHSRAMIRPQFVRDQIQDVTQLEHHVQNLMAALTAGIDSNGWTAPQDIVPLFFRETLDSSTEFLFGQSVESQLAALREKQSAGYHPPGGHPTGDQLAWEKFGPAFDTSTMEMAQRFRLNSMYFLHNTTKMRNACKEVHGFADHFVKQALESPPEKSLEKDSKQPYVFLHELVKSTRDPIELRDQVLNVLLAGRDTTAGLMAFVMYELARHPHIFAKLRSAVLNDFGTYENPRNMDFSGLKACSYLQQVLNEGLRLHPSVPINARRTVRDTTLPVGGGPDGKSPIFLPKGSEVTYSVHVMHRRVDLWGEDAHLFRPERWENRRPGWDFVPFNGGPRICLGQQFALTSAGYTIARICQRFDQFADLVPHTPNSDEEKYWCSVTVGPVHVQVRLHEAQNA